MVSSAVSWPGISVPISPTNFVRKYFGNSESTIATLPFTAGTLFNRLSADTPFPQTLRPPFFQIIHFPLVINGLLTKTLFFSGRFRSLLTAVLSRNNLCPKSARFSSPPPTSQNCSSSVETGEITNEGSTTARPDASSLLWQVDSITVGAIPTCIRVYCIAVSYNKL